MTQDEKIELIEKWLTDKHCTLWSVFDVVNEDTRNKAARWFLKEQEDFLIWLNAELDKK